MPILGVRDDTWHFRLWSWLHRMWDGEDSEYPTSLCVYSQFTFWIGMLSVATLPFMLLGWLFARVERTTYKVLCFLPWTKRRIEEIEAKAATERGYGEYHSPTWGDRIEKTQEKFKKQPFAAAFEKFMHLFLAIGVISVILFMLFMIIVIAILYGPQAPAVIWTAILHIGWAIFKIMSGLGILIVTAGEMLMAIGGCLLSHALIIGVVLGSIVVAGLISITILSILTKFLQTSMGKKLKGFLEFKMNGFAKARERNKKNKEEAMERNRKRWELKMAAKEAAMPKKKKQRVHKAPILDRIGNRFSEFFIKGKLTFDKNGHEIRALGLFPLVGHIIYSAYKGICPMMKIIETEEPGENDPCG